MKRTDMELQVIREKLLSLQTEPAADDGLLSPWANPQAAVSPKHSAGLSLVNGEQSSDRRSGGASSYSGHSQKIGATPPAIAIEALKQRVGNHHAGNHHPGNHYYSSGPSASDRTVADEVGSYELFELKRLADDINERSQRQADELLLLKRSAQKAAISLRRQGIHSHPQLDAIQQFLEQSSIVSVPNVEIDSQGLFHLTHTSVNLNQAEVDAVANASVLRRQQTRQPTAVPFSQPKEQNATEPSRKRSSGLPSGERHERNSRLTSNVPALRATHKRVLIRLKRYIKNNLLTNKRLSKDKGIAHTGDRTRFSWIDGIIWFVGAAIIRILLNALVINYSILKMPLLLILVGVISYSIYRIVLSKSTDMNATYRVGTALLGLFLGSVL